MHPLMKEWRVWVLIVALVLSFVMLQPHYVQGDNGNVQLATGINKGLDLEGGTRVLLDVQSNNTSQEQVDQVKNILQQRISAFGLTQTSVRTVRLADTYKIQLEIASNNQSRLTDLISQEGRFEARMPIRVSGERTYSVEEEHVLEWNQTAVTVDGENTYFKGDSFQIDNTTVYYVNNTDSYAELEINAYTGEDIQRVLTDQSLVQGGGTSYNFRFPVVLSDDAATRVQQISQNYDSVTINGQGYLGFDDGSAARLQLYVDGNQRSSLQVGAVFKTQVVTQPSINGGAQTASEARQEMRELQAILQSGKLPAPVEIESFSTISSALGDEFMSAAVISIIASLIAVGGLIYVRYGSMEYTVPIVLTGSSEVFILLGAFFSTIITLDLASIAGIIAAVGTGVDDQIIITDESGEDKLRDWKKRLKRAFFVIFTSAASTIGAMVPIVSPSIANLGITAAGLGLIGYALYSRKTKAHFLALGVFATATGFIIYQFDPSGFALQAIRGFAVTTILGVMVGITITRPAYAKFVEYID